MNLEDIALNIKRRSNKIYYSKTESDISYPDEGNDHCIQIEEDSFWFQHRNNVISDLVIKHTKGNSFFDVGGGNGFVSKRLQDDGIETILIEPGESGALNAQKRGLDNIVCSTFENAKFTPSTLDSVGVFDVVEHIEDDQSFINSLYYNLKKDGFIYITVPAFQTLWSSEDMDAGHFRRYTLNSINKILINAGFEIVYSSYFFSFLYIPILFFRTLATKIGLNKNSSDLDKHKNAHSSKRVSSKGMIQSVLNWEIKRIKRSKMIPIGSSCIVVAKKP